MLLYEKVILCKRLLYDELNTNSLILLSPVFGPAKCQWHRQTLSDPYLWLAILLSTKQMEETLPLWHRLYWGKIQKTKIFKAFSSVSMKLTKSRVLTFYINIHDLEIDNKMLFWFSHNGFSSSHNHVIVKHCQVT